MKNRKKAHPRKEPGAELDAFLQALDISVNLYPGEYGPHRLNTKRLALLRDRIQQEGPNIMEMVSNAKEVAEQENISHHIKVGKEGVSYLDVICDAKNNNLSVAVKLERAEKYSGYFKNATTQILLRVEDDKKTLTICPVVSIVPKNSENTWVVKEAEQEGGISHTCVSYSGEKLPKELQGKRVLQPNKGQTLSSRIARVQKIQQTDQLVNILHYMKQIGDEFKDMHKNGITHFDAKSDNILFKWFNADEKNIPYYSLIDRPDENASKEHSLDPNKRFHPKTVLQKTGMTWGKSIPHCHLGKGVAGVPVYWGISELKAILEFCRLPKDTITQVIEGAKDDTRKLYGHAVDSYAYLYNFYEQIYGSSELSQIFKPFLAEKIEAVLAQMQGIEQPWPPELTVESIQENFAKFCTEKNLDLVWQDVCDAATKVPAENPNMSLKQIAGLHKYQPIVLTEYLKEKLELHWCYTWTMWLLDTIERVLGSKKSRKEAYQDIKSLFEHGHENSFDKIRESIKAIDIIIHKGGLHAHDESLCKELARVKDTLFDIMVQMSYPEEQKPVSVNHYLRCVEMKKRLRRKLNTLSKRRKEPKMKWEDGISRSRIGGKKVYVKKIKFEKLGNHSVGFFSEQPRRVTGKEKWKKP